MLPAVCACCLWHLSLLCEPSAGFPDRTNTPNAIGLGGKVTSLDQSPGGWGSRMRWEGYRGWVGRHSELSDERDVRDKCDMWVGVKC